MAIDLRASITCNLGDVISGNLGDDYIQGSGLIKTQGSVLINSAITPVVGSSVVFSYRKNGIQRNIPRAVRVLSSFADPIRKTTQVELGCKLTYLSDLVDPIDWTAFSDSSNTDLTEEDARIITVPIKASTIMSKCLQELGISASSNPLTNKFSIQSFDLSPGYVQVLSDLLVSEGYFGYLDTSEVLTVSRLDTEPTSALLLDQSKIVDLGPIGVGPLPADAVTVSYSSLKLKDPETGESGSEDLVTSWETTEQSSSIEVPIAYRRRSFGVTEEELTTQSFKGEEVTVSRNFYKEINGRNVVIATNTMVQTLGVAAAGSYVTEMANLRGSLDNLLFTSGISIFDKATTFEIIRFTYNDQGDEIFQTTSVYKSDGEVLASTSMPFTRFASPDDTSNVVDFPGFGYRYSTSSINSLFPPTTGMMEVSRTTVDTEIAGDYSRVITKEYLAPYLTVRGQQYISASIEAARNVSDLEKVSDFILRGSPVLSKTTIDTSRKGVNTSQEKPSNADITNSTLSDGGDPNNGWRTESVAELELATGSATSQRRIEFSLPYAPDDTFSGPSGGPFESTRSDAKQKAVNYGRIQNRLLLGNRNGLSIQASPENLPTRPYDAISVSAQGYAAVYRVNAMQWSFDSSGIVCSTDALYWGLAGRT